MTDMRKRGRAERVAPAEIPEWYDQAACIGMTELFFYETLTAGRPSNQAKQEAIDICNTCKVITQCRDYALSLDDAGDPYGVWGGLAADQRRNIRRRRRAA